MQSAFSKQSLVEAGLCGAIYVGGERVISGVDLMHHGPMRFGLSAGSSIVSAPLSSKLPLSVANQAQYGDYLRYVVSGAVFTGVDYFAKSSNESMLYKFLLQTGAQASACYIRPMLVK